MDGMRTVRQQARIAGWLYLLMGVAAPIGLIYVPGKLVVSGDAAATAERIRAAEGLLRLGIASELFHQVVAIFLVLAFYRLFRGVNPGLARQVVILGALVSVPIVFVNVLNEIAALTLVHGAPFVAPFDQAQRDSLAYLFLRLHSHGLNVAQIFWGLWLFPLGLLAMGSGFIPRIIGFLLMLGGVGYLLDSATTLLVPSVAGPFRTIMMILGLSEVVMMLWLLVWGAVGPSADLPVDTPAEVV